MTINGTNKEIKVKPLQWYELNTGRHVVKNDISYEGELITIGGVDIHKVYEWNERTDKKKMFGYFYNGTKLKPKSQYIINNL